MQDAVAMTRQEREKARDWKEWGSGGERDTEKERKSGRAKERMTGGWSREAEELIDTTYYVLTEAARGGIVRERDLVTDDAKRPFSCAYTHLHIFVGTHHLVRMHTNSVDMNDWLVHIRL